MTTNNTFKYEILEGPSLEHVIDALKYAYTPNKLTVNFLVRYAEDHKNLGFGRNLEAQIVGVSYESGSPGMFILMVNINGYDTSKGLYNARTREGWLELERSASRVRYSDRRR